VSDDRPPPRPGSTRSSRRSLEIGRFVDDERDEVEFRPVELPEQRQSRLKREEQQAAQELEQQRIEVELRRRLLVIVFVPMVVVGVGAFTVSLSNRPADPDTQARARSIAPANIAGSVGYYSGSARRGGKERGGQEPPCYTRAAIGCARRLIAVPRASGE